MYRLVAVSTVIAGLLATAPSEAASYGSICKAPVLGYGHGQQVEPSLPDFGEPYARRVALADWVKKVSQLYGHGFANIRHARHVSYVNDPGAGQINMTLTASPCR